MNLNLLFPFISLVSLFVYFISADAFTSSFGKFLWSIIAVLFVSADLIYRFIQSRTEEVDTQRRMRFLVSGIGLSSFLLYQLREYLDFPTEAGIAEQASSLPKVRDFLLILIILSSLAFLIFTILLEISRQSFQAYHNLKIKKNSILQNTIYSFLWISPLLVAVNYFAVQKNYNFDLSAIGKFSFSPTSRQILKEVKKEIQVTAFFPRPLESDDRTREESFALGFIRPEVEIILDQLKSASPFISVKFINADVEKELMADYPQVSNGIILIRSLKAVTDSGANPYTEERVIVQTKKDLESIERKLVQGIINVSTSRKNIYFTASNGERYGAGFQNLPDEQITKLTNVLAFYNYQIKELGFTEGWPEKIPDDAEVLFIAGPTLAFSETARNTILSYIERNGKLFITIDPAGTEDFSWLLEKAGLVYKKENLRQVEGRPEIIANKFQAHPIEELFTKKETGVLFFGNGYFESKPTANTSLTNWTLLESGFSAFADLNKNGKLDKEEKQNSFILGTILSTKEDAANPAKTENPARIVIYSGTSWITNRYLQYNLNTILAVNSVNWLNQSPLTEKIIPKKEELEIISISDSQKIIIWSVGLFLYPMLVVSLLSFYVIVRKRKK
ncbi:MAG: Gldg family protein [Leptospiraceae bacterium]|nr:Gldg family protein [Leptospiraceae bacterium]MBK9500088.1 Gldg family protein [Leptospiraceae bacterium]MBP9161527.1 Gldg family protein [Leptospiraceae bacterium]